MGKPVQLSELTAQLEHYGAKPTHIRRILRAWMHRGSWEMKASACYPQALRDFLPQFRREVEGLSRVLPVESRDAEAMKLIVGLADGECVESVLLPRDGLCVSTQVGCAVGCRFCMTGRGGLVRQLGSAEILAQVAEAFARRPATKKIVMMGMGEPSHNLWAVNEAVQFLGTIIGLRHKDIVVSTVGDPRLFPFFLKEWVKPAVALSLHTLQPVLRRELLPKSPVIAPEEILSQALAYADAVKYPLQVEWTLMAGVNDSPQEIEQLGNLLTGRLAMVNFIAVNPIPGSPFVRPSSAHMQDLITILRHKRICATLRESAAQDVDGGCGQLRARVLNAQGIPIAEETK